MKTETILFIAASAALFIVSLPFWGLGLIAVIGGRLWSIPFLIVGLVLDFAAIIALYFAYRSYQKEEQVADKAMDDARYHNLERQAIVIAKKKNGIVRASDLVNVGIASKEAEEVLNRMTKKGLCAINADATRYSGVTTYMFPEEVKMRCQYCGTPVDLSMTKCLTCGAPVKWDKAMPGDVK